MAAANVEISVGTVLSVVSGVPATEDSAGYAALTWIEVGEVTNFGDSGGTAQIQTFTPVNSGIVHKRKGSKDYGTMALTLAKDATDVGQIALKAGFDGVNESAIHSCKIVEQGGEINYFQALVSSFSTSRGDANTIITHSCNLDRTSAAVVA